MLFVWKQAPFKKLCPQVRAVSVLIWDTLLNPLSRVRDDIFGGVAVHWMRLGTNNLESPPILQQMTRLDKIRKKRQKPSQIRALDCMYRQCSWMLQTVTRCEYCSATCLLAQ